jgi:hypothetical protein
MFLFPLFAALLAVATKRISKATVPGASRRTVTEVTLDNSYAEGGESLTPKELGLQRVTDAFCTIKNGTESEANPALSAWYDLENKKLRVINSKTQKEFVATTDLSKVVVIVMATGK